MRVAASPASAAGSSVAATGELMAFAYKAATAATSAACSFVRRYAWSGILVALTCPTERRAGGLGHWDKRAHKELPLAEGRLTQAAAPRCAWRRLRWARARWRWGPGRTPLPRRRPRSWRRSACRATRACSARWPRRTPARGAHPGKAVTAGLEWVPAWAPAPTGGPRMLEAATITLDPTSQADA